MSHCENCDRLLATDEDAKRYAGGEGEHLCWSRDGNCEPENWRERALRAEAKASRFMDELRACGEALQKALGERGEAWEEVETLRAAIDGEPWGSAVLKQQRDEAVKKLGITLEQLWATEKQRDEARAEVERLTALADESEHQMHLRIRAGYDKTVADAWRAALAKMERERDEARAALRDVAERQREACARFMEDERWYTSLAARRAPLVTESD